MHLGHGMMSLSSHIWLDDHTKTMPEKCFMYFDFLNIYAWGWDVMLETCPYTICDCKRSPAWRWAASRSSNEHLANSTARINSTAGRACLNLCTDLAFQDIPGFAQAPATRRPSIIMGCESNPVCPDLNHVGPESNRVCPEFNRICPESNRMHS